MLKSQIKVGGHYTALVSGKLTTVKVDKVSTDGRSLRYHVTNLATGRSTIFRSAARFRAAVEVAKPIPTKMKLTPTPAQQKVLDRAAEVLPPIAKSGKWFHLEERGASKGMDAAQVRARFAGCTSSQLAKVDEFLQTADVGKRLVIAGKAIKRVPDQGKAEAGKSISDPIGGAEAMNRLTPTNAASTTSLMKSIPTTTPTGTTGAATMTAVASTEKPNLLDTLRGGGFQAMLEKQRLALDLDTFQFKGGKTPTRQQRASIEKALEGVPVMVLEAGAGTGKTANFEMMAQVLPGNGQYTAFGKALADDAKVKFANTKVAVNTTHSLAFRAVGHKFADRLGGRRVKADEIARMLDIEEIILDVRLQQKDGSVVDVKRALAPGFLAGQVMSAIRRFCQSADQEVDVSHFKYIDGIDLPESGGRRVYANNRKVAEHLLEYARKAWEDLNDPKGQLPYWPDCYVKTWQLSNPIISADYILLDEAQDSAEVFLDILRQQVSPGRRNPPTLILVGDSAQQIYAWRGAVNAMAAFPDAPRLYLSQSFRFGEAIAVAANKVLETLDEPTPLRLQGLPSIPSKLEPLVNPACILCRTNAAAVAGMLGGIAAGKRPHLVGGGADVLAFTEAVLALQQGRSTSHPDLGCFGSWAEVQQYSQEDEGEDLRLWVKLVDTFGAQQIHDAVKNMPKEADADFVICTAHKSKGREWDTVKLGGDFPTNDKAGDEERRLLYVAVTRAKLVLDVSECPFFTGEGSVDLTAAVVASLQAKEHASESVIPATPASPPQTPAGKQEFSWARGKSDEWLIRGPKGCKPGTRVIVTRRNGSSSSAVLGKPVRDFDDCTFYEKGL